LFLGRTGSRESADGKKIAFIGVPIKAARETLGVLCIDRVVDRGVRSFDDDVRFLTMVSNLIGQTVRLYRSVAAERNQLLEEQRHLKKELQGKFKLDNVIGISKAMQEVFSEVHQSAPSRSTMLLRGESGTGKEVIARAIHYLSPRKDGPFIKLNCAALSETLLESELFGHEKGAFTGAQSERKGRFELAHGGTLFLDEIGDISPAFQAKLLRVLQEREFERVGGSRSIKVDVRLITATNRDLEKAVARGDFRADLYYRINVVSIFIPPLRERREDIPYLVEHFLNKFRSENHRTLTMTSQALSIMTNCFWPGNVRELENCVERTATMVRGDVINEIHFSCQQNKCLTQFLHEPLHLEPVLASSPLEYTAARGKTVIPITEVPSSVAPSQPTAERERLIWALEQCGWVQAKAARALNISPRQMGYALQKYNIEVKKF
jgi:Nif-specific regulatory protein